MKKRSFLLVGLAALAAAAIGLPSPAYADRAPVPQAERSATLAAASAALNAQRLIQGRFRQTGPDGSVSTGRFFLQRPGRVRFEYDPPAPLLIVADGSVLAVQDRQLRCRGMARAARHGRRGLTVRQQRWRTRYAWSVGRRRRITALLVAALALLGAVPAAASVASTNARDIAIVPTYGFQKWPGRTVTYWDASREPIAVTRAVAAWNRSGLRIQFVKARSARVAQLVIRNSRAVPSGCGSGQATVGLIRAPQKAYINILSDPTPNEQKCAWPGQTLVVAHELGHVLGLGHVARGCRLMNPNFVEGIAPSGCVTANEEDDYIARSATWRCRILEPSDVRAAVRLYGGTVRPVRADPDCDLVAPLAAPTLTATWNAADQRVELTIHRPAAQVIAPWLLPRADRTERLELHRSQDTCVATHTTRANPFTPTLQPTSTWTALPGTDQAAADGGVSAGTWCYSAWAIDSFGKHGTGPATATIVVPAA